MRSFALLWVTLIYFVILNYPFGVATEAMDLPAKAMSSSHHAINNALGELKLIFF
jgi:hypothetical protein